MNLCKDGENKKKETRHYQPVLKLLNDINGIKEIKG